MTQSPESIESKIEPAVCGKNHVAIAVGFCLMSASPSLILLVGGLLYQLGCRVDSVASAFGLLWLLAYLFVAGAGLWEAINLIHNQGLSSCCGKGRIAVAIGLCLTPWILFSTCCLVAPGGLGPFFHNPTVILVMVATTLWQILGLILLIRVKAPILSYLVMLFFIGPTGLMILFFPVSGFAVVTLLNAFSLMPK